MDISWHGRTCFALKGRNALVITDPVGKGSGHSFGPAVPDIVSLSRDDLPRDALDGKGVAKAVVLDAPGSYEVNGVLVNAVAARREDGLRNVAFAFEIDGIRVAHLGLPDVPLTRTAISDLGEIDVLLLPVGNPTSYSPKMASDVMNEIDPQVAIPMDYRTERDTGEELAPLDDFLKELGLKPEPQQAMKLTRGTMPQELTVSVLQVR